VQARRPRRRRGQKPEQRLVRLLPVIKALPNRRRVPALNHPPKARVLRRRARGLQRNPQAERKRATQRNRQARSLQLSHRQALRAKRARIKRAALKAPKRLRHLAESKNNYLTIRLDRICESGNAKSIPAFVLDRYQTLAVSIFAVSRARYFAPQNQKTPANNIVNETTKNATFMSQRSRMAPISGGEAMSPRR